MLTFAGLMIYYGWDFATAIVEYTPFLQANKVYWYLSIPVSGAIMAVTALRRSTNCLPIRCSAPWRRASNRKSFERIDVCS